MSVSPPGRTRLVVFTDLDGTLLDHHSYDWTPARPAVAELAARRVPLVLASSKTAAEIAPLHAELGLGDTPAIVENGAGVWSPGDVGADVDDYDRLRAALAGLPPGLRAGFRGFSDMTAQEVAQITGLAPVAAERARRRAFSEPGVWTGDDETRRAFLSALAEEGVAARQGGRFLTLSLGATKADRMGEVAAGLGATLTLALGDAPNDVEMLETADYGVIVRNDDGPGIPPLASETTGHVTRTRAPGPAGWNTAVLDFLQTHAEEARTRDG